MLEPVLTTHLSMNSFMTSKAMSAQKVVSARTMNSMIPVVINSIFLQILLASMLCSSSASMGAFLLLLAAIVLVLSWSVDVFSYLTALVYLGGVLVMLFYFTSFVTVTLRIWVSLSLVVVIGNPILYCNWVESVASLSEIYYGPIEVLLLILVYLLWFLSWVSQALATVRV